MTGPQLSAVPAISFTQTVWNRQKGLAKVRVIHGYLQQQLPLDFRLAAFFISERAKNNTTNFNVIYCLLPFATLDQAKEDVIRVLQLQKRTLHESRISDVPIVGIREFGEGQTLSRMCHIVVNAREQDKYLLNSKYQKYLEELLKNCIDLLKGTYKPELAYLLWQ